MSWQYSMFRNQKKQQIFSCLGPSQEMVHVSHLLNARIRVVLSVETVQLGNNYRNIYFSFIWHCFLGREKFQYYYAFKNRFGVCCLFITSTSGAEINNNCTYIQNPNYPSAYGAETAISFKVSKCSASRYSNSSIVL